MLSEKEFLDFSAEILGVPAASLSLETTYGSIPEWDSMAQLRLVMETAARYGAEIPFADVVRVTSLWEFLRRINGASPKKVLAVDLDNTLWDGVIGEDGVGGIRPKAAFLRKLRELKDRGILLVALSKNDEGDGLRGLENLKVLTKDDFVAWRIDWNDKADNLVAVADDLNLGTDAFVFVDDNPAERLRMSARLPEVAVTAFPPNLDAYFPPRELTEEDRTKTEEYRAEAQRKRLRQKLIPEGSRSGSDDLMFRELGVELDIHEITDDEVPRVAQLSQKANQLNACTNRYTEDGIRRAAADGLVVTAHAKDRFGDQGLVAYVIAGGGAIVDWTMSCRAMGRGIEGRVEAKVEELLRTRGTKALRAVWTDSGRNAPARDLFDRLGFTLVSDTGSERRYERILG